MNIFKCRHEHSKPAASIRAFLADQSGAVTVDWVMLTATVIVMAMGFMATFTTDLTAFVTAFIKTIV
jgi:hypothetical protein